MKLTKKIIAETYEEVATISDTVFANLNKSEYVAKVMSYVDDDVNRLYTDIYNRYYAECDVCGIDRNADDYSKRLADARKYGAALELIKEYIVFPRLEIIRKAMDKGLRFDDWGEYMFGTVVDHQGTTYKVYAHLDDDEIKKAEDANDYGLVDWNRLIRYRVEA